MRSIFKIASLLAMAMMAFACDGLDSTKNDEGNGGVNAGNVKSLVLMSDKDVIQADGKDAAVLRVIYDGKDVTTDAVIYNDKDEVQSLTEGKFTTTAVGEYKFYAEYGTVTTYDKNADDKGFYVIKAISVPVPAAVQDEEPSSTSFVHRAFLTQYTGTGCKFCPLMVKVIRDLMAKNVIPEKAVHAAVHS